MRKSVLALAAMALLVLCSSTAQAQEGVSLGYRAYMPDGVDGSANHEVSLLAVQGGGDTHLWELVRMTKDSSEAVVGLAQDFGWLTVGYGVGKEADHLDDWRQAAYVRAQSGSLTFTGLRQEGGSGERYDVAMTSDLRDDVAVGVHYLTDLDHDWGPTVAWSVRDNVSLVTTVTWNGAASVGLRWTGF